MGEIANQKVFELFFKAKNKIKNSKIEQSIKKMKFVQASMDDFSRIKKAYIDVIERSENINVYTRWVYGDHPTDAMIKEYIKAGYMYIYTDGDTLAGMMAITPSCDGVYHKIEWKKKLADDEAAVIHILTVTPDYQGFGLGNVMVKYAIDTATSKSYKSVRLDVLADNEPAQNLYKKYGFEYRGKENLQTQKSGWTDFYFYEKDL